MSALHSISSIEKDYSCPICREADPNEFIAHEKEGEKHPFHDGCLRKWMKINPKCPCCQEKIDTSILSLKERIVLKLRNRDGIFEIVQEGVRDLIILEPAFVGTLITAKLNNLFESSSSIAGLTAIAAGFYAGRSVRRVFPHVDPGVQMIASFFTSCTVCSFYASI